MTTTKFADHPNLPILLPETPGREEEYLPHTHTCPDCGAAHESTFRGTSAVCPDCLEKRQRALREADREKLAAEARASRTADWERLVPEDYRRTDWAAHAELSRVCHWLAKRWTLAGPERDERCGAERGLLIYGPTGRGKTRAMFGILSRLHFSGVPCHAVEAVGYAKDVVAAFDLRAPWGVRSAAQAALNAAKHARVLFFDDLGKEGGIPGFAREFHDLLEHRKRRCLPTLITSERVGAEMAETLGTNYADGIVRRIREVCAMFHTEQTVIQANIAA